MPVSTCKNQAIISLSKIDFMKVIFKSLVTAVATMAMCNITNAQNSGYHLLNTFKAAGDGGWDYVTVSQVTDKLYLSHGNQVNIISKTTGADIATIGSLEGVHGIALASQFGKGFISNGGSNTISVFNTATNTITATIPGGKKPDAIIYDHFSKRVYVGNGKSHDLTIINPANNHVEQTLDVDGKPEMIVSNDDGLLFLNLEDKNEVISINANTYFVEHRWRLGSGKEPTGLAIDKRTNRLFVGCGNGVMVVINAENGHIMKELPIGKGCDGVVFDPLSRMAFASCGDGTLSIIKENSPSEFTVLESVSTKKGARTIALDEKTHKVYLPTADFNANSEKDKHGRPSPVPGSFQVLVMGK